MGVSFSGYGIGDHRNLANKGVHEEAAGNNHGIYRRETNIRILYRGRAYGGVQ